MNKTIQVYDRKGTREIPFDDGRQSIMSAQAFPVVDWAMDSAQTVHTTDPIQRGKAMLLKSSAITVFLSLLTLAALFMLDGWSFFLWLLLASAEWVLCFLFLAVLDWREHPSAIRWNIANGVLYLMQREQDARFILQGINPKEIE